MFPSCEKHVQAYDEPLSPSESAHPPSSEPGLNPDQTQPGPGPSSSSPSEPLFHSESCSCTCGKCCCHGAKSLNHCVRCHANYTLNHPSACWVPHIFDNEAPRGATERCEGISVPSVCCGTGVSSCAPAQNSSSNVDWVFPSPCIWGWHTTSVGDVEGKYNGINVLRCVLNEDGRCVRRHLQYDDGTERRCVTFVMECDMREGYVCADEEDKKAFYKRILKICGREELRLMYCRKVVKSRAGGGDGGVSFEKVDPWESESEDDDDDIDAYGD